MCRGKRDFAQLAVEVLIEIRIHNSATAMRASCLICAFLHRDGLNSWSTRLDLVASMMF